MQLNVSSSRIFLQLKSFTNLLANWFIKKELTVKIKKREEFTETSLVRRRYRERVFENTKSQAIKNRHSF